MYTRLMYTLLTNHSTAMQSCVQNFSVIRIYDAPIFWQTGVNMFLRKEQVLDFSAIAQINLPHDVNFLERYNSNLY